MVKDRFSRFEEHIERLVEGSFSRLFSGHLHPREIAVQLARVMEDCAQPGEDGVGAAPHRYLVALHPADFDAILREQPDLAETLAGELVEMARAAGLHMPSQPSVRVVPDDSVASHRASVRADDAREAPDSTQELGVVDSPARAGPEALKAALVSGDDHRTIQLDREVVNIGRHRDNHIILEDPRVSRQHAQLRYRFGQYVLYDLDSQSGTIVNGQSVHEVILQHGDVISLGGVRLIYTQEGIDSSDGGSGPTDKPPEVDDTDGHTPLDASA